MSFKEHGLDKYARIVEQNVAQARYLAARVDAEPELERLAPVPLNIVCFRYVAQGLDEAQLNALNDELVIRLQEGGVALASSTRIHGKLCVRPSMTNHRTVTADLDVLADEVLRLGRTIAAEMTGEANRA
jgi:glutamate/tyrosine decarboxylase-like PLP-dependent enzyme